MDKLYRFCCAEEIRDFLKIGYTESLNCEFVSLTKDENSQGFDINDERWNYLITFDYNLVIQQGGFHVEYTTEFFESNPIIFNHVSQSLPLKIFEFVDENEYMDYVIENTINEQEVLVKHLRYDKGLVLKIDKFKNGIKKNIV